jgi:hypothetical protein
LTQLPAIPYRTKYVPLKLQYPFSSAQNCQVGAGVAVGGSNVGVGEAVGGMGVAVGGTAVGVGVSVGGTGVGLAEDAIWKTSQLLYTPTIGSPKTALLHETPLKYDPYA